MGGSLGGKRIASRSAGHPLAAARVSPRRRRLVGIGGLVLLIAAFLAFASEADAAELAITNVSPDRYFSPNGDNRENIAYVNYTLSTTSTVTIVIRDKGGSLIRTVASGVPQGVGGSQFSWNGREENGSPAPNGVYKYTVTAVDGAKEEASASGQIGLNRALPGTVD